MAYTVSWDEAQPDGSENANTLDTELQNLKISIRERLEDIINDWTNDGVDPKTLVLPTDARAIVTRSTAQTITTATVTAVSWDTEAIDTDTMVDISGQPTRITITTAGIYLFCANVEWGISATGDRSVAFRKNGSGIAARTMHPVQAAAGTQHQSCSYLANLAAADYIEAIVYQTSGGNLDLVTTSAALYMAAVRIA